ncbi:MAG: ElyC/SanA/YdcF family protein [Nibricoccus sp.]
MLFWLKKTLTIPFLPLYFTLLVGFAGLVLLFWTRRQKLGRGLLTLALLALAVFSNKGIARLLIAPLENQYAAIPEARSPSDLPSAARACRFIVVLGGGHGDSQKLSRLSQLSPSALGRLTEGVRLAHLLPEAKLVVSGYNGPVEFSHAQILAESAQSLGIVPGRIVRFDNTRDTDDEAQAIFREIGSQPFLLVTSAWHMPRAMALCKKAGLNPVAAPSDFMERDNREEIGLFVAWDMGALERSTKAIHERLGFFWAKLRKRA